MSAKSSKEEILQRLKRNCQHKLERPPFYQPAGEKPDWENFREALLEAGGELHLLRDNLELREFLQGLTGGTYLRAVTASAEREVLDRTIWMVASASFAVARTGSLLVTDAEVPVRSQLLLPENLVLIVDQKNLVWNLTDLYEKLTPRPEGYFTFITGPSKTADIEMTLVIGAHGPKRLVVVAVEKL